MRPHKNLEVWKEAMSLVKSIYQIAECLPTDEKFGLTSQLKRASVSVPTNISEGAARNTGKEFLHFLHISRGSLSEIDTLLQLALDLGYLEQSKLDQVMLKVDKVNALLNGLIKSVKSKHLT